MSAYKLADKLVHHEVSTCRPLARQCLTSPSISSKPCSPPPLGPRPPCSSARKEFTSKHSTSYTVEKWYRSQMINSTQVVNEHKQSKICYVVNPGRLHQNSQYPHTPTVTPQSSTNPPRGNLKEPLFVIASSEYICSKEFHDGGFTVERERNVPSSISRPSHAEVHVHGISFGTSSNCNSFAHRHTAMATASGLGGEGNVQHHLISKFPSPLSRVTIDQTSHDLVLATSPHPLEKQGEHKPNDEGRPTPAQMSFILLKLREELPAFFHGHHSYSVYIADLRFENKLSSSPWRMQSRKSYRVFLEGSRILMKVAYSQLNLDLLKITKNIDNGLVEARWRVRGKPRYLIMSKQRIVLEGFSTFVVNGDGLVCVHKMDRVMPAKKEPSKFVSWLMQLKSRVTLGLLPKPN